MTVYQWSDHRFAAYVGVTSRPFSGRFLGTEQTREGAQCLAAQAQHAQQNTRTDVDAWDNGPAGRPAGARERSTASLEAPALSKQEARPRQ
jgi:hypothetical protein